MICVQSLVCIIFDMAMVDSTANVLLARLSVHLFQSLPPFPSADSHGEITTFERLLLCKCRMELEHSSSPETLRHAPLVYVDESDSWRFIKTVRLLAEIFNNRMLSQNTRKCIIQVNFFQTASLDMLINFFFFKKKNINIGTVCDFFCITCKFRCS